MFKQIRSWIIRRKFDAMMAVADSSIDAVEARAQLNVALCAATYRDIDESPLMTRLLRAVDAAIAELRRD